mgnify:FL=1
MKYAMCFFPLVGVVTGILEVILGNALLVYTSCGTLFFAGVMTLLPVLVNGESTWTDSWTRWML